MIENNIAEVKENIKTACQKAGKSVEEIILIAVSKTKPVHLLQEAYKAGCRDFGENKVQEIQEKYPVMEKDIKWHMIGHLQRNKVKSVIDKVTLIHSVDSLRLAEEISKEAKKIDKIVDILIEVNIAKEESKYGVFPENVEETVRAISTLTNLRICGFMTVAPFVENPEENRVHFQEMYKLFVDIKSKNIDNTSIGVLSMGMTGDYAVAIEEGATMIRVGTGIFGERNYSK